MKPTRKNVWVKKVPNQNASATNQSQDNHSAIPPIYLVMLPGLDGTGLLFEPLIAHLPASITPIVVNYPTGLCLSYEALLPIVLKALPKEVPFVLLGESFGGPLAILAAGTKPKNLTGLILCASFITCPQPLVPKWAKSWVPAFPLRLAPKLLKFRRVFGDFAREDMQKALALVKPEVLAYRLQQVASVDVTEALKQLELPMLYLQANQDLLVPGANALRMQALQPNMQIAQFNTGHLLLQTKPELASVAIEAFVRQSILNH
jgi:pimeloyl-[acyl-carrier protein] methyl ester esterase